MLPPVEQLSLLSSSTKESVLSQLFEPCPALQRLVSPLTQNEYKSWSEFIEEVRKLMHSLNPDDPVVSQIIAAHPRLGAKKIDSTQSQAEQRSLGSENSELQAANAEYERTFPGLRYVVFVAGRPRSDILVDIRNRITEHNYNKEVRRAFDAMCDIALDRQKKLSLSKI